MNILTIVYFRKKTNYFFRHADYISMEIQSTLELPLLKADFVCEETEMRIYANDIIFNQSYRKSTKLIFQNCHTCPAEIEAVINDPLKILKDNDNQNGGRHIYVVQPLSHLEVDIIKGNVLFISIHHCFRLQ